jgi:hypothetical protein
VSTGILLNASRKHAQKTLVAGMSLTNLETLAEVGGPGTLEWAIFSQVVPNPLGRKMPVQLEHAAMMLTFRDGALPALTLEGYVVAKTLWQAIEAGGAGNQALPKIQDPDGTQRPECPVAHISLRQTTSVGLRRYRAISQKRLLF